MKFYSTNNHSESVSFEEALLRGLAPDYGLYTIPRESVPNLSKETIAAMKDKSYADIAYDVLLPYLSDDFTPEELHALLKDAYDPNIITLPLQHVTGKTHLVWLSHGPTLSFKDFAARFFGRSLNHFLQKRNKKRLVVVATSGDTGGAIAAALHNLPAVTCVVLYPKDDVSEVQRRQMTTLGGNVHAIAVEGDFDLCQSLAKRLINDTAFAESTFGDTEHITSANSISLGRLLPQMVFPFYAYANIDHTPDEPFICSIPSGNFGDMMGAVFAHHMGLPITRIICGVNENVTFPRFLDTGVYSIDPTKYSPSSAMMVSHPSNVARLFDLYNGHIYDARDTQGKVTVAGVIDTQPDTLSMKQLISSHSVSNADHFTTMRSVYDRFNVVIEPHGAVGWKTLEDAFPNHDTLSFVYETADPIKFADDVTKATGVTPTEPTIVTAQKNTQEHVSVLQKPESGDLYDACKALIASMR